MCYVASSASTSPTKAGDGLYNSQAIRRLVGINLARDTAPDVTTLLKFRHLTESLFNALNAHLAEKGLLLREGTIIDATLTHCARWPHLTALPSRRTRQASAAEMHQSKKGNQWYFVIGTVGNVSDISQAQALLHGGESAFGDADIRVSRSA